MPIFSSDGRCAVQRLAQRALGAKRLFLLSLGLFSLGALAAGLANSLSELILWRTLQGWAAGC